MGSTATLKTRVVRSVGWEAVSRGSQQAVALLSTMVLARLLSPASFGVMGMATLFITFVSVSSEFVIPAAIVQKKEMDREALSSLFWFNLALGISMTLLLAAVAPAAATFFREPMVGEILPVLACIFTISAAGTIQRALFYREMNLRKTALSQAAGNVAGLVIAILLALRGAGVWSLVASALTARVVDSALMWVLNPWRPGLRLRWSDVRPVAGFGLGISGYGVANYFSKNGDILIVGRFLGSAPLGYYQNGYALTYYPQQVITALVNGVALAPLSRVQNDNERFRAGVLTLAAFMALLLFPVMAGLMVTSDLVVAALLGGKWAPSAPVVSILALNGLLQTCGAPAMQVFMGKGKGSLLFRWAFTATVLNMIAFLAGLPWGIRGVAATYVVVTGVLLVPMLRSALALIGMPLAAYLKNLAPVLAITLGMAASVLAWRWAMAAAGVRQLHWMLGSSVAVGIGSYCALALWAWPPAVRNLFELLRSADVGVVKGLAQRVVEVRARPA